MDGEVVSCSGSYNPHTFLNFTTHLEHKVALAPRGAPEERGATAALLERAAVRRRRLRLSAAGQRV